MKLLTYNIRYDNPGDGPNSWPNRRHLVADLVTAGDWDVVFFQEALPHQRAFLEGLLPNYHWLGRGREEDGSGEQCCVATRQQPDQSGVFWFGPTPEQPGSKGWDAKHPRLATWFDLAGRTLVNVHFDHDGYQARHRGAQQLLDFLQDRPAIVAGDLNAWPQSDPIKLLTTRFRDSFAAIHPGSLQGTYHEFGTLAQPTRIDYVLTDPDIEVLDCQIFDPAAPPYGSDHHPVGVTLAL